MSQYLNFYLKAKDGHYIPIYSVSRSGVLYSAMQMYVPYGELAPLKLESFRGCKRIIESDIRDFEKQRDYMQEFKNDIFKCESDLNDKLTALYEQDKDIHEINELIDECKYAIHVISIFMELIDNAYYSDYITNQDDYIYAGIEA